MNFEQLTATWAAQPLVTPAAPATLAELQRTVIPELRRRSRFIGYEIFLNVTGLVILPLLAIANYRHAPPQYPAWHWGYFSLWMLLMIVWLVAALRSLRRHGGWLQRSTQSLREFTLASLASIESEMRSYRIALALLPAIVVLQLVNISLRFPVSELGWPSFASRAALIVGLPLVLGLVFWRHYRVNLTPDLARQRELLQQLH